MKYQDLFTTAKWLFGMLLFVTATVFADDDKEQRVVELEGWGKAGYNAHEYRTGFLDTPQEEGKAQVGFIQALRLTPSIRAFATLMRTAGIKEYRGKRIQLTSYIKTASASSAGAWFRVNGKTQTLSLDNMSDRRLSGSKDWRKVTLVLDIPEDAETVSYGVLLEGKGNVWFEMPTFHVVDQTVAVTNKERRGDQLQGDRKHLPLQISVQRRMGSPPAYRQTAPQRVTPNERTAAAKKNK